MNRRAVIRAAIPATLLVITPPSCSAFTTTTTTAAAAGPTVVINAASTVCWKATVDGQHFSGCGNKTITTQGSTHRATVWKTDGDGGLTVSVTSNGQVLDQGSVQSNGHYVRVDDN